MKSYRVWAFDKAPRSVVIEANSKREAMKEATELVALGEWDERVEQDGGQICEWQITSAEELPN